MFSRGTIDLYCNVWQSHLRNETVVDKLRHENRSLLCMQTAFKQIDFNGDGYVDKEDVRLSSNNFLVEGVLRNAHFIRA